MKKIIALVIVLVVMLAMPLSAYAVETDLITEAETTDPATDATEPDFSAEAKHITDQIMAYIEEHLEELSVIITMFLTVLYQIRKHKLLNKSIGTLNNNAVAVSENSATAISTALLGVENASHVVGSYRDEMTALLAEVRKTAEDRNRLEAALLHAENYINTSRLANVELANEVAELLVLANIPNSKKDELYARHRAAVDAIAKAEAIETGEVMSNDSEEA